MSEQMRILVAEDHLVARVGVTTIVNMQPDMTVVAEASNGQQAVELYPPLLKARILGDSLWSAEFTLQHARGFAAAGDVYSTTGCLGRIAANLTQALYALYSIR